MSGIRLLNVKIASPIKNVVQGVSGKIRNSRNTGSCYFDNFEKQDKKSKKGFFEFCFGKDNYITIKRMAGKYKWIKDSSIKKHINAKINNDGILSHYQQIYNEDLMDAYNVLQGHYSMLGDVDNYYKTYKEYFGENNAKSLVASMKDQENVVNSTLNFFRKKNDKEQISFELKLIDFKHDSRTEALKKYVAQYSQKEPEMTNYMYTKYYLPRLSQNVRKNCAKISEEFGTKVFVYDEQKQPNLDFIYDELTDWKTKSKNEAKFPSIIDLSKIKNEYLNRIQDNDMVHANGLFPPKNKSISLYQLSSIRHEMIHLNEKDPSLWVFQIENILRRRLFQEEIFNANINIGFAYESKSELIAYAGSKNPSLFSTEFQGFLKGLGLPEWVFNLKPLKQVAEE